MKGRRRFGVGQCRQRGIAKGKLGPAMTPSDFERCARCGTQRWRHYLQTRNGTLLLGHDFVPQESQS
jgi:hypothetical protein